VLTVAPLASGQARYYLSLTASSYYTDAPEPDGYWYGPGAEEFGLSGLVQDDHLTRLCEGFDPHDPDKGLVRNAGVKDGPRARKHGDDLCFSAPKSVSVAWALATPEMQQAIQKAMHRAVKDALDYIQETCGWARVGAQGQRLARIPLVMALFEHCSSRLGDPQLHVHAVIANIARHSRDHCTAIDSIHFYHHMMAGGALFRASLAQGMRDLGFDVERDGFSFRLKGFHEALCERFSQRRAEIVDAILKRAGGDKTFSEVDAREVLRAASGRTAELINLETRRGKQEYTRAELFPVWQAIARSMGIEEHYVSRLVNSPRSLGPGEKAFVKEELFKETLEKLGEEYSHFSEKDIVRRTAEEAQGKGLNAREVRELVHHKIGTQEVLRLGDLVTERKHQDKTAYRERSEERFTTEDILKREGLMLGSVERMAKKSSMVRRDLVEWAIAQTSKTLAAKGHTLTDEQKDATRHLTAGPGLIACMTGKAGTGKSTTLEACRLAWERAGFTVLGCALAGVAKDGLHRSSGIKSDTLAMTLINLENGRLRLSPRHVIVLDEAGMVATKPLARLIAHIEKAGAKLVLVGDAAQLQAIGAGGGFRSIAERVGQKILTHIIRQREEWRRDTVEKFSRGEAREALIAYVANNQLHVTRTRDEAISKLVGAWRDSGGVEKPKDVLLLASTNHEVSTINRQCQMVRFVANQLREASLRIGEEVIHEGDRVLLTRRSKPLGVENGFKGELVRIFDGPCPKLVIRLDLDDREVTLSVKDYGARHIQLGYASTTHKAQGQTVEHCDVLMGGHMTDLHMGYVQASRSRESTRLFVDQAHAGPELRDAIRSLSRDCSKDLATDILDGTREAMRLRAQAEAQQRAADAQRTQEPRHERTLGISL
jgi:Ti-type conjugative transfer relaxase TraA